MRATRHSSPVTRGDRRLRAAGVVVPNAPRWHQWLAAWLIFALVRSISATLRYRWHDGSGFYDQPPTGAAIYCVWHNRLALCLEMYHRYARQRNNTPGMAALVSASRDGALLTAILERFKVQPVRGSTSRRGPQALLELTSWSERGYDLAITPDGPRGPCYVVQDGIMSLAQLTGLPILPVAYHLPRKICAKSWDRFQIPLPFSLCNVHVAKPVRVPRDASDAEREALREQLERTLKGITYD
jgi:lysophospholipid acyltransferase (LPLAT)-like uncharacterized protein